ncbi:hypothetical protein DOE73_25360 [Paenibacillus dendritiformis]|nr:hypothetical protein DOE73_25360 [Paenibacillus dendritiformis]
MEGTAMLLLPAPLIFLVSIAIMDFYGLSRRAVGADCFFFVCGAQVALAEGSLSGSPSQPA